MYEVLFNKNGLDLNKEKCNLLSLCDNLIKIGLFLRSNFLLDQTI